MTRMHQQADRELSATRQENQRLTASLQQAEQKQTELEKQLEDHSQAKAKKAVRWLSRKHVVMFFVVSVQRLLHKQTKQFPFQTAHDVSQQESRARVKLIETQLRDLKVEHELLLQAFEKVSRCVSPLTAARWDVLTGRF